MDKQIKEKELPVAIYMSGHGLDWADSKDIANQLYEQGYRKIPEGSVVISKEEYEALRLIEKYHIKSCGKNSVVLTTEEYQKLKMLEKYHITCEDVSEYITNAHDQAIKEFAKRLKMQFEDSLGVFYPTSTIEKRIDEIAKSLRKNIQTSKTTQANQIGIKGEQL